MNAIKLFNNIFQSFIGHSGQVKKIVSTKDDSYILSVGIDGIIVWKFLGDVTRDLSLVLDNYIEKRMNEVEYAQREQERKSAYP